MHISRNGRNGLIMGTLIVCGLGFRTMFNSPVKGSVSPSNGGLRAWVFSKTDTANASVTEGNFLIDNVKPGSYTLMVEGKPPYRNSVKEGVVVAEGQPTDVGVIEMTP